MGGIPVFELRFDLSSSRYYAQAVRLAAEQVDYEEIRTGRRRQHTCRFGTSAGELLALVELWEIVRTWRSSRLIINGLPVLPRKRWSAGQMLECAAQAAEFSPPQRYCCSAPVKDSLAWPGRPHFPCRHLLLHGFGYLLDERVEWHEPDRRLTQLQAILVERGIAQCPFLNLHPFVRALEEWHPRPPRDPAYPRGFPGPWLG
jgi:hypothetical protein